MTTYSEALPGIEYGLSGQVVLSIYQDEEQKIWIGTDGGGINKFNPDTRKFNHILPT
jgi:ligand-binding sensor domain-containing protein